MKKQFVICMIAFLCSLTVYGQEGFNNVYGEDWVGGVFNALELKGDTIYAFGTALEHDEPYWGLLVARMDTSGNLIDYQIHYDEEGNEFTGNLTGRSVTKLSDGSGFAMAGRLFYQTENYFLKLDNYGQITHFKRYSQQQPEFGFTTFRQILEIEDGFLILGSRTLVSINKLHMFVMRINHEGKKLWEKGFMPEGNRRFTGTVVVNESGDFLLAGGTSPFSTVPPHLRLYTSLLISFDKDGEELWRFESEPTTEELGVGKLFFAPNGNLIYPSAKAFYASAQDLPTQQPVIVIRDSEFNLIERKYFGPDDRLNNQFFSFLELSSGWLAIGVKPYKYPTAPHGGKYNATTGWLLRVDEDIEKVWSRVDTARWSPNLGSENFLFDAVLLPSGSIIAGGYYRDRENYRDYPWLIKVDKDGCMYADDCGTFITNVEEIIQDMEMQISIYPNPTTDKVNILIEEEIPDKDIRVQVYNMAGKLVYSAVHQKRDIQLDISPLPSAPYNLIILQGQKVIGGKKIMVQR